MKTVFVDTNIVIDLLAKRKPFFIDAAAMFSLADKKVITVQVSVLTIANANYIITKFTSAKKARKALKDLNVLVDIVAINSKIVNLALNDASFKDFEDGLQYYSAIENLADLIITRNQKDFSNSTIPVMAAGQFLKMQ